MGLKKKERERERKNKLIRNSLVAWWLEFWAFTSVAWVQSLVGEMRSREMCGATK